MLASRVAASRGREGISIVTSDVERLGESLGVSMARPSAMELANEFSQSKQAHEHPVGMNSKEVSEALRPTRDVGFEYGIGIGF